MMHITHRIDVWTQRLRAIAQTGLAFEPHAYDRERYEELLKLAGDMASLRADLSEDAALSQSLYEKWRAEVGAREKGYVTPRVGVGAVVFNDQGELLLVKRAQTGNWLYVTGWADVGYAPAEVAIKEVLEETGLRVTPLRVIAVYDSLRRSQPLHDNHFWSVTFLCRLDGGELRGHAHETLDLGFFARDRLPAPLSRDGVPWIAHCFDAHAGGMTEPYFDRQ